MPEMKIEVEKTSDMVKPLTEEEHRNLPWCHLYAQYTWHSPARIQGTRVALMKIRDAIDRALTTGMDGEAVGLIASDGEGYSVEVQVRNLEYLEGQTLPYTASYAGGVGAQAAEDAIKDMKLMDEHREAEDEKRKAEEGEFKGVP